MPPARSFMPFLPEAGFNGTVTARHRLAVFHFVTRSFQDYVEVRPLAIACALRRLQRHCIECIRSQPQHRKLLATAVLHARADVGQVCLDKWRGWVQKKGNHTTGGPFTFAFQRKCRRSSDQLACFRAIERDWHLDGDHASCHLPDDLVPVDARLPKGAQARRGGPQRGAVRMTEPLSPQEERRRVRRGMVLDSLRSEGHSEGRVALDALDEQARVRRALVLDVLRAPAGAQSAHFREGVEAGELEEH